MVAETANVSVDEQLDQRLVAEAFVAEAFDVEVMVRTFKFIGRSPGHLPCIQRTIQGRFTDWKLRAESTQLRSGDIPKRNFKVTRRRQPAPF